MADDDKVVKTASQAPANPPEVQPSAQTFKQATAHDPDDRSEWTVSDARGPLHRADEAAMEAGREIPPAEPTTAAEWTASDARPRHTAPEQMSEIAADERPEKSDSLAAALAENPPSPLAEDARRSLWPVAAALLVGAVLGAGSAAVVYRSMQGNVEPDHTAQFSARLDAQDATLAGLKKSVADLGGKLAAVQKPGDAAPAAPAPDLAPLQQKIAGLESGLQAVQERGASAEGLDAKIAALEGAVAGLKTQASTAQAGAAAEQKDLAGKVMVPALAVAADSLVQQIDQGQPYAAQVDALAALGADPVKIGVLRQNAEKGVASAKVLATKFEPLAEPIAASAHKAPANASFADRLKSGMLSMVSVRRADDTSGDDPASRVARIKADLAHDDVADALAAWDSLPADARAKGEGWAALVKAHAEAIAAARALQHEAIAALAKKS